MTTFKTGFNKGEEIMIECDQGRHWTDRGNNIFVDIELDDDYQPTGKFRVAELAHGNGHRIWAKNMELYDALELAERFVVGPGYIPDPRPATSTEEERKYDVGFILDQDMHLHQINDPELSALFEMDHNTLMTHDAEIWPGNQFGERKHFPNKIAFVVAVRNPMDNDIPDSMLIAYVYDHDYYSVILKKKS